MKVGSGKGGTARWPKFSTVPEKGQNLGKPLVRGKEGLLRGIRKGAHSDEKP